MPRRPPTPPLTDQIEETSQKLFELLLEYDRDEKGNFRKSVHAYLEKRLRELDRQARIQELQSQLNHMDIEMTLLRIQELQSQERTLTVVKPTEEKKEA